MRPFEMAERLLIAAVFAQYEPGGVLVYNELMAVLPVWSRSRLAFTIADIWVDSEESLAGGRALWSIPKELARFARQDTPGGVELTAGQGNQQIASVQVRSRMRLHPWWQAVPIVTAQQAADGSVVARNVVVGRTRAASTTWSFDPRGRLGYLAGGRQLGSIEVPDLAVTFGIRA